MSRKAKISGFGAYLPEAIVRNEELTASLDTSDEWIRSRSGIEQRHIADKAQMTSDLAVVAAEAALRNANMSADDIDLIVCATTTPDKTFPATAVYVQQKLGMAHGAAFDLQAVCSGFVYGLSVVGSMIETGQAHRALLIGAETMSRILDWEDRSTAVLFGDGAGAIVLEATEIEDETQPHLMGSYLRSDGSLADLLYVEGGPSSSDAVGKLQMNGREVYRHAVGKIADAITCLLQTHQLSVDDIDWFVPHQANRRIIDGVAQRIGLPAEKTVITLNSHANTSAASIPLALCEAAQSGRVKSGDLLMLESMGGGLTWGANLIRWG